MEFGICIISQILRWFIIYLFSYLGRGKKLERKKKGERKRPWDRGETEREEEKNGRREKEENRVFDLGFVLLPMVWFACMLFKVSQFLTDLWNPILLILFY